MKYALTHFHIHLHLSVFVNATHMANQSLAIMEFHMSPYPSLKCTDKYLAKLHGMDKSTLHSDTAYCYLMYYKCCVFLITATKPW